MAWPKWWDWELELTSHLETRMEDRDFTEVDLRQMLEGVRDLHEDVLPGRWIVETRHAGEAWELIVEPDPNEKLLVVITAYPLHR